ncbi:hypothetical protein [Chryseobacterium indoltheticum]|uniref:DUF5045 domain-containing protein n=1 Tax=Chryseobacterium indoltheticum TaxID=254 RepID=A0A381FC50_9FLAO|nr:hypothetical protein [Chryseobacterium indoltheticum]AZA73802.1 hypothetical protein EG358_08565 [Chryseobacterium indoltheticum]SIQ95773.1 hypothetical protein SAMN05421682_110149 [Chryseobacterium indoltheticum]SUX44038.1 Uncharacterised protein [Chryseobacterium indoltheticum]
MKKSLSKLIAIVLLNTSASAFGQFTVKRLNDPAIVAQHKRMVFESWGNFKPDPKYVLGVQTNFAYATVWGWMAPSINRDYKDGDDIRPLKPTGIEVQRLAELEIQQEYAEKVKKESDTIYKRNVQDFANWTSATVDADPLWLLYYKKMLKPLKEFPVHPQSFGEWGIKDDVTYQSMKSNGSIDNLQEKLDLLKDQYEKSRTLDMPRGKRFLMYHETLAGWRKFLKQLRSFNQKNTLFLDYKNLLTVLKSGMQAHRSQTDVQIVQSIMAHYHNKY